MTLRGSAALYLIALLFPALAQASGISIDGCVAAPGGRPVAGIRVDLRPVLSIHENGVRELQGQGAPEPVERTATDADGCFTLRAPAAGMWKVGVEASGFVPVEHGLIPLLEDISLPIVDLEPDTGLRVRIEEDAGRPLPGARVRVIRTSPEPWTGWVTARREGVTGADGALRLPRAAVEDFDVWAAAPGWLPRQSPQVRSASLSLRLDRGVLRTLELTREEDGKPLAGALILHNASRLILGRSGTDGKITLAMPATDWFEILTLGVDGRAAGSRIRAKSREVDAISLVLPGPVAMQGVVEDSASHRPVAGALVWPEHDPAAFVRATGKGKFRLPWTPGSGVRIVAAAPGTRWNAEKPRSAASPLRIALEPVPRIDGLVVDVEGRPVAGAEVRAIDYYGSPFGPPDVHRSRSDASGHFRMPLTEGDYQLSAAKPGFAPAFSSVRLSSSGKRPTVRMVLGPSRVLTGLVVDGEGRPVHGAEVELKRTPGRNTGSVLVSSLEGLESHRARTGPEGRFEVRDLPASWFRLRIEHPDFASHQRRGIIIPEEAGPVDAGTFTLAAGLTVEGIVVDSQDRPLPDTALWLRPGDGIDHVFLKRGPRQVTGPDGRFSIPNLEPEEEWTLYACRQGHPEVILPLAKAAPGPLRIELASAARLTGRVVDPDGHPVSGAYVRADVAGENPWDAIDVGRPPCSGDGKFPDANTDGDGRFVLEPLPAGFYAFHVSAEGFLVTEPELLEVDVDRELPAMEVVLERGAILIGRVLMADGSPAAGATVRATGGRSSPPTLTDQNGSYRLQGVEPGSRLVSADHTVGSARQQDVQIGPGENRLDLTLESEASEPERTIHGRVVGPQGEPIEGAQVTGSRGGPVFTEPDGSFTLAEDENPITAWKEGYGPARIDVDFQNPPAGGVEIRLEKGLTLTGRLLGLDPSEISTAVVDVPESGVLHPSAVFPDGTYRIGDLGPGEWTVTADAAGIEAEGRVVLRAGEEGATLDLVFTERFDVRGRIVGPGGEGIAAKIMITSPSGRVEHLESRQDGAFGIRLENGDYEIEVSAPGYQPPSGRKFTVADAPVDGLEIQLESGLILRGCVRDFPARSDPGDAFSRVDAESSGGRVSADPDPKGCYQLDTLSEGSWTLTATLFETRAKRSRQVRTEVLLRPGTEAVADLDFFLGDLTLSGRVEAAEELLSTLEAVLITPDENLVIDAGALQEDAFHFDRLRAGSYRLRIQDDEAKILLDQPVDLTADRTIVLSLSSVK
ncbi:MAG TPA: carboxypeptidase-like regulatory domain-containing protein [Thermoanaerobaculia bacterium]